MDRNSSHGLLKLILAGVVLILIIVVANYMNSGKVSTGGLNQIASALLLPSTAAAAANTIYCPQPVVLGTSMTKAEQVRYAASGTVLQIGVPTYMQAAACPYFKTAYSMFPNIAAIVESGNGNPALACDMPQTLAASKYTVVCK